MLAGMVTTRDRRGNSASAGRGARRLLPALAVLVTALPASADETTGNMAAERFEPAPGPKNFITVEGARTEGNMAWSGTALVSFGLNPIAIASCTTTTDCSAPDATNKTELKVVNAIVTGHLLGSLTPIPRLQLGLRLPISYAHGDGIDPGTGQAKRGGFSGGSIGDPAIEAKVRAVGKADDPLVLGASAFVSAPLGRATSPGYFLGDTGPVLGVRGIADIGSGPFGLGLNLGAIYRGKETLGSVELGPAMRYGVAGSFRVSPILRLVAEGFGETRFSNVAGTTTLEVDGMIHVTPLGSNISVLAGAGGGIIHGVGAPDFRGFGGLSYVFDQGDADGDGIRDDRDGCPHDAEDRDGYQDDDGCPEVDNDRDGIPDKLDKCPNEPETVNGFEDEDGCPDSVPDRDHDGIIDTEDMCPDDGGPDVIRAKGKWYGCPDRDHDGVPDKVDQCPSEVEDTDGFEDENGCPDPDNDQDGVPDIEDECINEPGSKENHGCPDPDKDGDGIPDRLDKCPDKPETYNGYQDEDGCPDTVPGALVEVTEDGIRIKEQIQFATSSDKIVGPKSFKILDQVATVLKADQNIFQVEVAGHTDDVGDAASNKELSKKRAESVRKYLTEKRAVPGRKLSAAGYGAEKPIADNKSDAGRKQNRRVEFVIVKSKSKGNAEPK